MSGDCVLVRGGEHGINRTGALRVYSPGLASTLQPVSTI